MKKIILIFLLSLIGFSPAFIYASSDKVLVAKYKVELQEKLSGRLDDINIEKLTKLKERITIAKSQYSSNNDISTKKQERVLSILTALYEIVDEYIDASDKTKSISETSSIIDMQIKCIELHNLLKKDLWEEIGNNKVIYHEKMDTCLAMNITNNTTIGKYSAMVYDLKERDFIHYYYNHTNIRFYGSFGCKHSYHYYDSIDEDGSVIDDEGCDRLDLFDKSWKRILSLGFSY